MTQMDILPPPKPRLHELYIKKAALKTGVNVIPNRLSMLTKKLTMSGVFACIVDNVIEAVSIMQIFLLLPAW